MPPKICSLRFTKEMDALPLRHPRLEPLAARHHVIAPNLRHYYPEPWKGRRHPIA
jgi:hypothetical protein